MRRFLVPSLVLAALAPAAGASAAPVCAGGSASAAARALYGDGTTLTSISRVAGLRSALAAQPLVEPSTRRRMLAVPGGWCDAADGFDRATSLTGAAAARAFVSVAAAPYFDGITVESLRATAPGVYDVVTHAETNGVEAQWMIVTDGAGLVTATWTAKRFAVHPFTPSIEGLTALPGGSETYTRAGGTLVEKRGLPVPGSRLAAAPADTPGVAQYTGPDGMTLRVAVGDTHVAPDAGADTGQFDADIVRDTLRSLKLNYEDFLSWGFTKGWTPMTQDYAGATLLPDTGFVSINDSLSLYCQACVLVSDEFNIHFISAVEEFLTALGYTYPAGEEQKTLDDILGHEMFHNFQNRYDHPGEPGASNGSSSTSYTEGTARFQQTLHSYADVERQTGGLYYATDANGCNGYDNDTQTTMDAAMAEGVFPKGYEACYFWSAWYGTYGKDALVKLVSHSYPANFTTTDANAKGLAAISDASGDSVLTQMQHFAVAALTGQHLAWGEISGDATPYDWGKDLDRWKPAALAAGQTATGNLANGGMMARELKQAATVSVTNNTSLALFEVRSTATDSAVTALPRAGSLVDAPAAGEHVWVVAIRPSAGTSNSVTLRAA